LVGGAEEEVSKPKILPDDSIKWNGGEKHQGRSPPSERGGGNLRVHQVRKKRPRGRCLLTRRRKEHTVRGNQWERLDKIPKSGMGGENESAKREHHCR